jgi:hypothetical protein
MLHGVQTMLHLGLRVACCGLYATCLWASGIVHVALGCRLLHGAGCTLYACALRVARWMLRNASFVRLGAVFVTASLLLG